MIVILYFFIILQWVMNIYIPLICFVGLVISLVAENGTHVMHNPYLGIIKVSKNKAIIIWSIRLILLGTIICGYFEWYRNGISPFIPL